MEEKVRIIKLYGKLRAKFGREHRAVVANTADAINYLCKMIPGFEKELMTSKDRGVAYACFIGKKNLTEDELLFPAGEDEIRIAPVIQGAKSGGWLVAIAGVALMVFAPYLAGAAFSAGFVGTAVAVANYGFIIGASLALTGVAMAMSPRQQNMGTQDRPDNGASYNFNGVAVTSAQGNPWPFGYGRTINGGALVSMSVFAEDMA